VSPTFACCCGRVPQCVSEATHSIPSRTVFTTQHGPEINENILGKCFRSSSQSSTILMSFAALLQAVAKLRFDDTVIRSDVDAAIALMRASQASIEPELQKRTREDPVSRLYMVCPPVHSRNAVVAQHLCMSLPQQSVRGCCAQRSAR